MIFMFQINYNQTSSMQVQFFTPTYFTITFKNTLLLLPVVYKVFKVCTSITHNQFDILMNETSCLQNVSNTSKNGLMFRVYRTWIEELPWFQLTWWVTSVLLTLLYRRSATWHLLDLYSHAYSEKVTKQKF